jgi:hypothetical protein
MEGLKDLFVRNRAKIGGVLSLIGGGIASINPEVIATNPRVSAWVLLLFGAVFGGGQFKSDIYHRDKQQDEGKL